METDCKEIMVKREYSQSQVPLVLTFCTVLNHFINKIYLIPFVCYIISLLSFLIITLCLSFKICIIRILLIACILAFKQCCYLSLSIMVEGKPSEGLMGLVNGPSDTVIFAK